MKRKKKKINKKRHSILEESQSSHDDIETGDKPSDERRPLIPKNKAEEDQDEEDVCTGPCFPFYTKNEKVLKCMWGITIPFFALIVLALIGLTIAALVVIPISKAFSDVPNRLVGFYQTAIVIAGVYIAYKGFFKKKPTLERAIKKRIKHIVGHGRDKSKNKKWNRLSKDEKVAEFYDHVVDLIANYDPQQRKPEQTDRKDDKKNEEAQPPKENVQEQGGNNLGKLEVEADVPPGNEEGESGAAVAEDSGVVGGKSEEPREQ